MKSSHIELKSGERMVIVYEDRSVLAIDKPAGWLLAPESWQETGRNLQRALSAGIREREFWARSRQLKFLRYVHRLDAETTGIVLFAKSAGAVQAYSRLFEERQMEKRYLAIVQGTPGSTDWSCRLKLSPDPSRRGRMKVDPRGKPAETRFRLLASHEGFSLIEARPITGRTHQIRVHLAETGLPVAGDALYAAARADRFPGLALRAVELRYKDPFTRRSIDIRAPEEDFLRAYGFSGCMKKGHAEPV